MSALHNSFGRAERGACCTPERFFDANSTKTTQPLQPAADASHTGQRRAGVSCRHRPRSKRWAIGREVDAPARRRRIPARQSRACTKIQHVLCGFASPCQWRMSIERRRRLHRFPFVERGCPCDARTCDCARPCDKDDDVSGSAEVQFCHEFRGLCQTVKDVGGHGWPRIRRGRRCYAG